MADIAAQRDALAARFQTVTYLDTDGVTTRNLRAANLQDQVNPPMVLIGPDDPFIDYDLTMARGADTHRYRGLLLVGRTSERGAQDLIDYLLTNDRLKTAIDSGWPASGIDFAELMQIGAYGEYTINDIAYLGCELKIEVIG